MFNLNQLIREAPESSFNFKEYKDRAPYAKLQRSRFHKEARERGMTVCGRNRGFNTQLLVVNEEDWFTNVEYYGFSKCKKCTELAKG